MTRLDDTDTDRYETAGRPLPDVEIRVASDEAAKPAELSVRTAQPMLGYWRGSEPTATVLDERGWYRTGDIATIDPSGAVRILGRASDVVERPDLRVPIAEIERVLERIVGAREVALVDAEDAAGRPALCAFVVSDGTAIDTETVAPGAAGVLPPGLSLAHVEAIPRLPRTTDGKVKKVDLRARARVLITEPLLPNPEDPWPQA